MWKQTTHLLVEYCILYCLFPINNKWSLPIIFCCLGSILVCLGSDWNVAPAEVIGTALGSLGKLKDNKYMSYMQIYIVLKKRSGN